MTNTETKTATTVTLMTSTGHVCADCPAKAPYLSWTGPIFKCTPATYAFISTFKGINTIHVCTPCARNRGLL